MAIVSKKKKQLFGGHMKGIENNRARRVPVEAENSCRRTNTFRGEEGIRCGERLV